MKDNTYTIYLSSTSFKFWNFRDKNWKNKFMHYLSDVKKIEKVEYIDPLKVLSDKPEIVSQDINDISSSNCIVCYLGKKITIGTIMEIMYSIMYYKIHEIDFPIILIDKYKIHRHHPWIKYWIPYIADDEEDASNIIENLITNLNN